MDKTQQKALKDFVSEAEEILEGLSEDIDQAESQFLDKDKIRPDLVNKIFRGMHSLKGLASMLALDKITDLAHDLESMMDRLRMGKIKPSKAFFISILEANTILKNLVGGVLNKAMNNIDINEVVRKIHDVTSEKKEEGNVSPFAKVNLDPNILKSFTEYEEHRLKENVEEGNNIYSIQVSFDLTDFDERLRALSERLNKLGEIISTLPVIDTDGKGGISFRLIHASSSTLEDIKKETGIPGSTINSIFESSPEGKGTVTEEIQEEKASSEPSQEEELHPLSSTVKVDIDKLDNVMSLIGELSLIKSSLMRLSFRLMEFPEIRDVNRDLTKNTRSMEKKLSDLQKAIIDIRMVPIGQIFNRLARSTRKLARDFGKKINLSFYGGDTELDKMMIDELLTPMIHLIRNSIDHGIEKPEDRRKKGKSEEGQLMIAAYQKGNAIIIEVTDDGKGIDLDRIKKTAIQKGLMEMEDALNLETALEFIFLPGFSSSEKVTEVSGRGVGLDVVKEKIEAIKGTISVWSEFGKGTTFQIELPITLAMIQSLIVTCKNQKFAIPISSIVESFRINKDEIQWVDQREVITLRGATLPLLRLSERFHISGNGSELVNLYVVIARKGEKPIGIIVDSLEGEQETVIHPLGNKLGHIPGIAGATEVGENEIILVLDTIGLFGGIEAKGV